MLRASSLGLNSTFLTSSTTRIRLSCPKPRSLQLRRSTHIRLNSYAASERQASPSQPHERVTHANPTGDAEIPFETEPSVGRHQHQRKLNCNEPPVGAGRPYTPLPIKPVTSPAERHFMRAEAEEAFAEYLSGSVDPLQEPPTLSAQDGHAQGEEADSKRDMATVLRDANSTFIIPSNSEAAIDDAATEIPAATSEAVSSRVAITTHSELVSIHAKWLSVLGQSSSPSEVWDAFSALENLPNPLGEQSRFPKIPFSHLHRMCRVLSRNRPKPRSQFARLLHVVRYIHDTGGRILLHEWNALIDHCGWGWRKTRPEDFQLALELFDDMVAGRVPGSANEVFVEGVKLRERVEPDTVTYNTLLRIAARTLHGPCIRRATALLNASGLKPDRYTHLSMLRYFTFTHRLSGVQTTLMEMKAQGLTLGLDGVNACIWAYAHTGHLDLVVDVYRVLRHHVWPEHYVGADDVDSVARRLSDEEGIVIDAESRPNEVTYQIIVQTMAYHGDLSTALNAFMDMLVTPNLEVGAPIDEDEDGKQRPANYSPTVPLFRALFLGFSRHGVPSSSPSAVPAASLFKEQAKWNKATLLELFKVFMSLPEGVRPSRSVFYWIMVAFIRTSADDPVLIRKVWNQLEERFNGPWGGPNNRLQHLRAQLLAGVDPAHILSHHPGVRDAQRMSRK
ncbi:hypothetical protein HGRIS_009245 [Hohenbuehelia grisea]|uniref:Pentatricopeptide repeat protein n=1 Tax=Hohenbuehelia grisea TaxID=104357 RepID=A0ABR3J0Q2_9AGAR